MADQGTSSESQQPQQPTRDWLAVVATAPAKFILSGEYGVVYGRQAIAMAVDLTTTTRIVPRDDGKIRLTLKQLSYTVEWPTSIFSLSKIVTKRFDILEYRQNLVDRINALAQPNATVTIARNFSNQAEKLAHAKQADDATAAFLLLYLGLGDSYHHSARPAIDVHVDSSIPAGSGLGSSSAYAVSLCGALLRVFCVSAEKYIISEWAHNIDKLFHGKPSGIDNSTICYGGYILYQCNTIKSESTLKRSSLKVLLIDTGVSRRTRDMMQKLTQQLVENEDRVTRIFDEVNDLTTLMWRKVNEPAFKATDIHNQIKTNQELLVSLGVGHDKLTDICRIALRYGIAAKLTGAGGGGMAIALYDAGCPNAQALRQELSSKGYKVFDCECGSNGLIVTTTPDPEATLVAQMSRAS